MGVAGLLTLRGGVLQSHAPVAESTVASVEVQLSADQTGQTTLVVGAGSSPEEDTAMWRKDSDERLRGSSYPQEWR